MPLRFYERQRGKLISCSRFSVLSLACGEQGRSGLSDLQSERVLEAGVGAQHCIESLFIPVENRFLATTHLIGLLVYLPKLQLEQVSH